MELHEAMAELDGDGSDKVDMDEFRVYWDKVKDEGGGLLKALMYDEQTMGGTLLVKVGQILNGSIMIVALLILILSIWILSYENDLYYYPTVTTMMIALALTGTSVLLVLGTRSGEVFMISIGNWLLVGFTLSFLMAALFLSLSSGTIGDLHQDVKNDWGDIKTIWIGMTPNFARPDALLIYARSLLALGHVL